MINDLFKSFSIEDQEREDIKMIRQAFDDLYKKVCKATPEHNVHYKTLVGMKLEEACFYAVKAIARK
jgi:predicted phage-related endonuclease